MEAVVKATRNTRMSDVVWVGNSTKELDFTVVEKPIMADGFVIPDKKAIFRTDAEFPQYFATVSKKYKIVKHEDIVEKLEEGMNFKNASVKTILAKKWRTDAEDVYDQRLQRTCTKGRFHFSRYQNNK